MLWEGVLVLGVGGGWAIYGVGLRSVLRVGASCGYGFDLASGLGLYFF